MLVTVTTVDAGPSQTVKRVLIRSEKVAGWCSKALFSEGAWAGETAAQDDLRGEPSAATAGGAGTAVGYPKSSKSLWYISKTSAAVSGS